MTSWPRAERRSLHLAFIAVLVALCGPVMAAEPHTPPPGSVERKSILNALRIPLVRATKQQVIFIVNRLHVQDGWAFVDAKPRRPGGLRLNFENTRWQDAQEDGVLEDSVTALLRKRGHNWEVLEWNLGATDVVWVEWPERHGAPRSLFPR